MEAVGAASRSLALTGEPHVHPYPTHFSPDRSCRSLVAVPAEVPAHSGELVLVPAHANRGVLGRGEPRVLIAQKALDMRHLRCTAPIQKACRDIVEVHFKKWRSRNVPKPGDILARSLQKPDSL
jgi:hypothetical protein